MPVRTLAPKGVDLVGWSPHRLKEEKSANEDTGSQKGKIVTSHISRGGEQTGGKVF